VKIEKVLNNNVVVALDENGAETVLMGRGLGFGRTFGGSAAGGAAAAAEGTKHRRTRWKSGSRCTRISFPTGSSS